MEPNKQVLIATNARGKIGFQSNLKFANTDLELYQLHRKVFKHYCLNTLEYERSETRLLLKIFDVFINEDNIRLYINRSAEAIYLAIINEQMDKLADYTLKN